MKSKILLFLVLASFLAIPFGGKTQVNVQDSLALVDLYNSTNGPAWTDHTNWLTKAPVSSWFGITLDNSGRVYTIQLNDNNLDGVLPGSIGDLTNIYILSFVNNALHGRIPSQIGNLINLHELQLVSNNFIDTIPASFGNLTNVVYIIMIGNHLTGNIPPELGKLPKLSELSLGSNSLSGPIPASLGNIQTLHSIDLSLNKLSGTIPSELGNLSNLSFLSLGSNNLTGSIPESIGKLVNLFMFDVRNNNLSGKIPSSFGLLNNLQALYLANNKLSGTIPAEIGNMQKLEEIRLSHNNISGSIPAALCNATSLSQIFLDSNYISGEVPANIGNLQNLVVFNASCNQLTGTIPAGLGSIQNLQTLYLNNNKLSGSLPDELSGMQSLSVFNIDHNKFSGTIPSSFINDLYALQFFNISNNYFTFNEIEPFVEPFRFMHFTYAPQDTILPLKYSNYTFNVNAGGTLINNTYKWFKNGTLVKTIIGDSTYAAPLSGEYNVLVTSSVVNKLTLYSDTVKVTIPPSVQDSLILVDLYKSTDGANWQFKNNWLTSAPVSTWDGVTQNAQDKRVTALDLSFNRLTGTIPAPLYSLDRLKRLNLTGNSLMDTVSSQISNLHLLTYLGLAANKFSGQIPASISNLTSLDTLYLGGNTFTGTIPSSFGNLTNLVFLSLGSNNLTGSIPSSIGNLTNLSYFGCNVNSLTGEIPASIGNLSQLKIITLNTNKLTGSIPAELGNLSNLTFLSLSDNSLSGTIPSSLTSFTHLSSFDLYNNNFTFAGMEEIYTKYPFLLYFPQNNIPIQRQGNTLFVYAGGTTATNTYTWFKNNESFATVTGDSSITISEEGDYRVTVSNQILKRLQLHSDTIHYAISHNIMPAKPGTMAASYEINTNDGWTHYYYDNNTPTDLRDDTLLLSLKKNGQNIGAIGDGTFAVKLVATAGAGKNTGIKLTSPLITNSSGYWVMNRYWRVTATHEPASSVGVRFYYNNQDLKDVNGSYPTHNLTNDKLIFYKAVGGNPDPSSNLAGATKIISILPGNHASDTSWVYYSLSDTTQYGEYSVAGFSGGGGGGTGNNKALPVTLVNFTAAVAKTNVKLSWQTAQEINTGNYTIERSLNGITFTAIGKAEAAGNSSVTQSYNYTDVNALAFNNIKLYYRLKITDKDGSFSYSKIISLANDDISKQFLLYPNPAHEVVMVKFDAIIAGKYTIKVITADGKVVKQFNLTATAGSNKAMINTGALPAGSYQVFISSSTENKTLTLIKE